MPTVTNTAGGKISGYIALTLEAAYAAAANDAVMMSADYTCVKADGSKPVVGYVDTPNVRRTGGTYPAANNPGPVAVEARGFSVRTLKVATGATVVVGTSVGVDSTGNVAPSGSGVADIGIALMGGAAAASIDVLIR